MYLFLTRKVGNRFKNLAEAPSLHFILLSEHSAQKNISSAMSHSAFQEVKRFSSLLH